MEKQFGYNLKQARSALGLPVYFNKRTLDEKYERQLILLKDELKRSSVDYYELYMSNPIQKLEKYYDYVSNYIKFMDELGIPLSTEIPTFNSIKRKYFQLVNSKYVGEPIYEYYKKLIIGFYKRFIDSYIIGQSIEINTFAAEENRLIGAFLYEYSIRHFITINDLKEIGKVNSLMDATKKLYTYERSKGIDARVASTIDEYNYLSEFSGVDIKKVKKEVEEKVSNGQYNSKHEALLDTSKIVERECDIVRESNNIEQTLNDALFELCLDEETNEIIMHLMDKIELIQERIRLQFKAHRISSIQNAIKLFKSLVKREISQYKLRYDEYLTIESKLTNNQDEEVLTYLLLLKNSIGDASYFEYYKDLIKSKSGKRFVFRPKNNDVR